MSSPFRVVASARLGVESSESAEAVHLLALALQSTLVTPVLISRLCSTLSGLLRAERCVVVEDSNPSDPSFALVKEAFARKEAVQAEGGYSLICAPLFAERQPEGAILAARAAASPFSPQELKLLATIAPQAGFAMHHARLYERATCDGLTGLPNRQRFSVELEDAVSSGGTFSLLLADLDNFKDKNDVYGHAVGDRVLAELGSLLQGRLDPSTCVARSGDDEFVALLRGVDAAHARDLAEDFRRSVNDRVFDADHEGIHVTLSTGVAGLKQGEMASSFFARAADALAAAKRAGRNRVETAK
ncbi:MAG TPA: sensor domain-containing diguanylate cyclase [Planctomycetota bacterium]|jgi:diguanylate cyclase (GGDEF)-like protein|nr:sensor domain-containing diguanylate cyclase [Planctomycetota bacterium]